MSDDPGFLLRGIPEADEFENVYEALASPPAMHDGERLLPPVQRRRIVVRRLSNYFQPGMRHLRLYEGIIGQIRDAMRGGPAPWPSTTAASVRLPTSISTES